MSDNRTPEQRRADLRAQVARVLSGALEPGDRGAWAELIGVSHQHIDNCAAAAKQLHLADALVAPDAARIALAQLLAGDRHAVVARVEAAAAPLDLAALAELSSSGNDFTVAALRALSDGTLTPAEERELLALVESHEKRLASLRSALRSRVDQMRMVRS